ncbi:MAG TPA: hypothetical protein VFS00_04255 [Polyangiaceae bacterium]|nr:hypothetical protein [Polyangiaceae bacterium]
MHAKFEARRLRFETSWSPDDVIAMVRAHAEAPGPAPYLRGEFGPGRFRLRLQRDTSSLPGPFVDGVARPGPGGGCRLEIAVHEGGELASALALNAIIVLVGALLSLVGVVLFGSAPSLGSTALLLPSAIAAICCSTLYRHGRDAIASFLADVRLVDRFFDERLPAAAGRAAGGPFRLAGRAGHLS